MPNRFCRALNLRHLRAFVAVAEHGSFTQAARQLSISQPALTITINQLEDLSGTKLFVRTTRKVCLSAGGEDFLPLAQKLLQDVESAFQMLNRSASQRNGIINMAILPSIAIKLMPKVIQDFKQEQQDIKVNLRDDNARGVYHQVRSNKADFGICNHWEDAADLHFTPLFFDRVGVVCLPNHDLSQKQGPIEWQEIEGLNFANMSQDTGVNALINQAHGLPESVYTPEYEVLTMAALAGIIEADLAITALPAIAVPRLTDCALVYRELIEPVVDRQVFIITRKDQALGPSAKLLFDLLITHFAGRRLWLENGVAQSSTEQCELNSA